TLWRTSSTPSSTRGSCWSDVGAHERSRRTWLGGLWDQPGGLVAGCLLVLMTGAGGLGPHLAPPEPTRTSRRVRAAPSRARAMGTDYLGRDVLSRVIWGSRLSVLVAVVSAVISVGLGLGIGTFAGYHRGRIDSMLMRATDGFMVLPAFFLLVVVVSLFGSGV